MRQRLLVVPKAERKALLVQLLGEAVTRVLAYPPSTRLSPEQGFFDLGMESIQAMQLVEHLEGALGLDLYPTLAFDHSTLHALADFLLERLPAEVEAPPAPRQAVPGEVVLARQHWADAPITAPPSLQLEAVLLLGGEAAHAGAFTTWLRVQGLTAPVIHARQGAAFIDDAEAPVLDVSDAQQVQHLLGALARRNIHPSHVFHLTSLDAQVQDAEDPLSGFSRLLGLAQGLLAHRADGAVRLVHVHATRDGALAPSQAALAGFARALGLETPRLSLRVLALPPEHLAPADIARLAMDNSAMDDVEVRYVAGRRQARGLVALTTGANRASTLRQGGAYLITGGAGGLGLLLAEHLVRTHRARVALAGRSELDEARQRRLEALRAAGAHVVYLRGDVADRPSATRLVQEAQTALGALHGIIHAAGATRDALIPAKSREQSNAVVGPKVLGALHLDEASKHLALDFMAFFSSTAAITGNVGQSDYAFANAFLDAFAIEREARRARGERHGRTVSFNWPLWADGGMRVDAQTLRFMERRGGLTPLPSALGWEVFEQGLAQDGAQCVVFHGARDVIVQRFGVAAEPPPEPPPPAPAPGPSRALAPPPASTAHLDAREPIAIIGMACRFPGGCDSPEALWRFLLEGGDAIVDVPPERWDADTYFDANPDAEGGCYVRQAGFLRESPALFDARLFGISPREAADMDPQQRLLLEVSWEALERAGLAPDGLTGRPVGVFVGMGTAEYGLLLRDAHQFGAYTATGMATNIASGRIAHRLGLQGPALTVDTACSSSLMAVHLACDSLRKGESEMALAGGVNLMVSPYPFVSLCRLGALAPDGRCKTFDAAANGYGRAEGGGMVVLKRLADARRDGDPVLAVLLGSAANHDGASSGLTVPSGLAQQVLLRQALASSGLEARRISYVEAHGTGTSLGDPIEMQALGAVYGQRPADAAPFTVGALKANLGHLEAAAGIAGLIKTVLCLQHQRIPKQPHLRQLNPLLRLERMRAQLPWDTLPWEGEDRVAGVSAFGFSGTNVHVIVGEPPEVPRPAPAPRRPLHFLPLSARDDAALSALARRWQAHLALVPETELAAACAAAVTARSHLEHRAAIVAADGAALGTALQALAEGRAAPGLTRAVAEPGTAPRLTVALPQGGDMASLVAELSSREPRFAEAYDAAGATALTLLGGDARALATKELTAFRARFALLQLLDHWGYHPDALMADGASRYVAACAAGVMTLRDALRCLLRDLNLHPSFTLAAEHLSEPRLRLVDIREPLGAAAATHPSTWSAPPAAAGNWLAGCASLDAPERRIIVSLGDTGQPWLDAASATAPWQALLDCVAHLYTRGLAPGRRAFTEAMPRPERIPPTYPFQRKAYWLRDTSRPGTEAPPVRDALDGLPARSDSAGRVLTYHLSHARLPELADNHGVAHVGYLQELLTRAVRRHLGVPAFALRDVRFLAALHVGATETRELRLTTEPLEQGRTRLLLQGRATPRSEWSIHVQAEMEPAEVTRRAPAPLPDLEGATQWDGATFYRRLAELSFKLGDSVKWVDEVRFREGEALARFRPHAGADVPAPGLGFHPGILDACAQLCAVAGAAYLEARMRFMVVGWESIQLHQTPTDDALWCHITFPAPPDAGGRLTGHFRLLDGAGALVAEARGHRLQLLSASRVEALEQALHETPAVAPAPGAVRGAVLSGLDAEARRATVTHFLTERAASHLDMDPAAVPPALPLRELGLDSITGLSLRRDIEERFSLRVPAEVMLEGPSIEDLGAALLTQLASATAPAPRPATSPWFAHEARRPRPTLRLFCFPYGGGGASLYRDWARLPEHIEVWPLQLPGRETRIHEPPISELEALLPQLVDALRPHLDVPFAFYGHSLGGLLAYLVASRLRALGLPQPRHLIVGGASAPRHAPGPFLEDLQRRFRAVGYEGIPRYDAGAPLTPLLDIALRTPEGQSLQGADADFARALLPMLLADLKLMEGYRHQPEPPFAFPITVMHGDSDDRVTAASARDWRLLTQGDFAWLTTPGDHFFLRAGQAQDWLLARLAAAFPPPDAAEAPLPAALGQ
ncbi:SDR family NAD(P)-dependent oxidoreductase [Myxococcus xanthus]|uniref:SDR family NAD(P)-dependent oxidoreductase n=1 Tax=Myxococcus xanthus TaxID=34 RepID=A0A7Y4MT72_MYXXA|nr:SDR family NAD(P)-dependent oxidoreductase [Myxococcus xanthus]NOJ81821.1 SDR family NAD(P)-dependent oxidoreductase [Myxococcus xanthus]